MKRQPPLALCALILAPTILSAQATLPPPTAADLNADGSFSYRCDAPDRCFYLPPGEQPTRAPGLVANRAENPTFDQSATTGQLRAWTYAEGVAGTGTAAWNSLDRSGSPSSGSALLTYSGTPAGTSTIRLSQCFTRSGSSVSLGVDLLFPAAQGVSSGVTAMIEVKGFSDLGCTTPFSITGVVGHGWILAPDTIGVWKHAGAGVTLDPAIKSIRVDLLLRRTNSGPRPANYVHFDDVQVAGGQLYYVGKGDMDRDGETDLILRNNVTGDNSVWFMKDENQDGGTASISPALASLDWQIVGVDDFNRNYREDLLTWNSATGATEIWLMSGVTRLGDPVGLIDAPTLPWKPSATADVNLDGYPDIVWRNYSTQKLAVWTMNGTSQLGTVTPKPDQAVDANWEVVGAPDVNKDGQTDLLWYNWSSGKIVYWLMKYSADSTECSGQSLAAPCYYRLLGNFTNPANAGANNWKVLAAGDYGIGPSLDGPGLPDTTDLVWRNATSGRMVVWYMDRAGNRTGGIFMAPDPPAPATDWTVAGPR